MSNEPMLDEPMLGDGLYPPRAFHSTKRLDRWGEEHNPHLGGTPEYYLWLAGMYNNQVGMLGHWSTDRLQRVVAILYSAAALNLVIQIVILIVRSNP